MGLQYKCMEWVNSVGFQALAYNMGLELGRWAMEEGEGDGWQDLAYSKGVQYKY